MRQKIVIIFILILVSYVFANNIFSECDVISQTDQVTISWITSSENNVANFQILRSNDSEFYYELDKINPKGPGSLYEYIDEEVMFKSSNAIFYIVRAIDKNGKVLEESPHVVRKQVSDIKETWGAIKALFQ